MPENHLFEYAVIRVVPRVEREEFVNVGVIVLCAKQNFLETKIQLNDVRLNALCPNLDRGELQEHIQSFERICKGGLDSGPIGQLPLAERFRWLTAARSTMVQTSHVHPGLCTDPHQILNRLFDQVVV
ncbi:MAG: DUF3037 domain-containing protein [Bacteroidetes bacterium]|nr:DUF3037 domain-containing protein [Bacteroidota bacterium]